MENLILELNNKIPLYRQIYVKISNDIRNGTLKAGEKLPGKRTLAQNLNISVNTVGTAYQMLVAEGYIDPKARSGYTVVNFEYAYEFNNEIKNAKKQAQSKSNINAQNNEDDIVLNEKYNFGTAGIDTSLFPFKTWCRLQKEVFAKSTLILNHGNRQGDIELRTAIAKHLREFRGASCMPQQIIVGAGIEYLLSLLALMFAKSAFAVENPGYYRATKILKNSGASVINVPVDAHGMSVKYLSACSAKLAYITPSHQFPTGVTMPIARRLAMLNWAAQKKDRYIIEDDYNSEFRFDGKPLPALQGLDNEEKVIYISTFSKSIAPAVRIAYMVLPFSLLQLYRQTFGFYSCTVSRIEQQTLSKFIKGGYFARHLSRIRTQYKQRRDYLIKCIEQSFGNKVEIKGSHTGLHFVISTKKLQCDAANEIEQAMIKAAQKHNINLTGMSNFYNDDIEEENIENVHGIILGYGGLLYDDIFNAVNLLKDSWKDII